MFTLIRCAGFASFITILALSVASAELPYRVEAAIDEAVNLELQQQQIVGAAIGVIDEGRIVYVQGYGLANREKAIPVQKYTIFNWASNSKPLAAVAALQLVQRKKLDLDADVRLYVPEFPDKGFKITPRHLLCHQSGIPHYSNGAIIPLLPRAGHPSSHASPIESVNRFSRSPLLFEPGSQISYSTYAYILLSAVIERAGEEPFASQVQSRIAKQAGMKSLQLDTTSNDAENWVVGYIKNRKGEIVAAPEEANEWKFGGGGFKSSIEDFARWALALVNHRLLNRSLEEEMYTPQTLSDGTITDWGLGFNVTHQNGLKVSHNGEQNEATTRLVIYMRDRRAVVVMTNCRYATVGRISTAVFTALNRTMSR
jgi:CubicO group peptidase (beta-lactamase class C family)